MLFSYYLLACYGQMSHNKRTIFVPKELNHLKLFLKCFNTTRKITLKDYVRLRRNTWKQEQDSVLSQITIRNMPKSCNRWTFSSNLRPKRMDGVFFYTSFNATFYVATVYALSLRLHRKSLRFGDKILTFYFCNDLTTFWNLPNIPEKLLKHCYTFLYKLSWRSALQVRPVNLTVHL